jgi:hypothetical protein
MNVATLYQQTAITTTNNLLSYYMMAQSAFSNRPEVVSSAGITPEKISF